MKVIYGINKIPSSKKISVLAIGMFDGVHKGHRKIIKTAVARAKERDGRSVVLTFDRHPAKILKPESHPPILTPVPLKLRLFEELGVDITVVVRFTKSFANLGPAEFIDLITSKFKVAEIVIGRNFHFGRKGAGDTPFLKEYGLQHGFKVVSLALVKEKRGKISSTRVRGLLQKGDLKGVRSILGRHPLVWGKVIKGAGRGGQLGFHTANIRCLDRASLPGKGVYAGYIRILPQSKKRKCVIAIGTAPTFKESKPRLEAHILDYKGNIYGKEVELVVITRMREERVFEGGKALAEQVAKDIDKARKILKD